MRTPNGNNVKDNSILVVLALAKPQPRRSQLRAYRCQLTAARNLSRKLKQLHKPLCSKPRLSPAAVSSSLSDKHGLEMWPRFKTNFLGPYFVSSGNLNKFALYARSNFKTNTHIIYD